MRRLRTGRGTLALKRLAPDDASGIERFASKYSLPHLADFIIHVERLQEGDEERYGRRYQREALRSGCLSVVSPVTANLVTSRESVPTVRGGVGYRFHDGFEFFVLSLQVRMGFPLAGLYLPDENCLLTWGSRAAIKAHDAPHIANALHKERAAGDDIVAARPTMVIGHRNFAHHIWNDLPALETLLREGGFVRPPNVLMRRESLGPLTAIFPEVTGWTIEHATDEEWSRAGRRLFVNVAGTRLSNEFRERLVRYVEAAASKDIVSLIGRIRDLAVPVFWLSIRTQPPTLTNQTDVLVAISRRLLQRFEACCIIFDGFSLPEDWDSAADMTAFYVAAVAEAKDAIEQIVARLWEVRRSERQMLIEAGGLKVVDSIALAQVASTYFCHVGTIQHKIGWTTRAPGMIHGNRHILATEPAVRHTICADGALAPAAIDLDLVADEDASHGKEANYRALDVEKLADSVFECLAGYVLQ